MSFAGIGGAFLVGLTAFFSPCILPVIPVFISTLLGGMDGRQRSVRLGRLTIYAGPVLRVTAFALDVAVTFSLLGLAFGALGQMFNATWFLISCSVVVMLFGVYQTGILTIPFLMREKRLALKARSGAPGAFVLGFTYAFGWTPCVGLSLGGLLLFVTPQGLLAAALTLLVYSLGFVIPFFIAAVFSDILLNKIKGLYRHMKTIKVIGGLIIIAMGAYLLIDALVK